ncbi:hypothetical protein MLD63_12930 [Paracoccus sp. TK19116]|uniref:DUF2946 domain-containing protein n=1 Tax=Paracoccus albicereus TaxID=2922394 RepID=A0ABT1MSQ6_9RHOB|nr:DUF2946 family protein [Paracoccus albicereus]MCQ0971327.1 hypothetical protein [Paracoccus albicereus]
MIRRDAQLAIPLLPGLPGLRAFGWLLLLPFLLFATISQGTMLQAGPAGVRIVLCTGDGVVEAIMAPDGQVHRIDDNAPADHPQTSTCDWALHAQPSMSDGGPALIAAPMLALRTAYSIDVPFSARRAEVLTPAARGPPALV